MYLLRAEKRKRSLQQFNLSIYYFLLYLNFNLFIYIFSAYCVISFIPFFNLLNETFNRSQHNGNKVKPHFQYHFCHSKLVNFRFFILIQKKKKKYLYLSNMSLLYPRVLWCLPALCLCLSVYDVYLCRFITVFVCVCFLGRYMARACSLSECTF